MTSMTIDTEHPVVIPCQGFKLDGILHIPQGAKSLVLFVHGSGSSRFSSRNQFVSRVLQKNRIATLLFDLLTAEEDKIDAQTSEFRFDLELLSSRLLTTTDWIRQQPVTHQLPLGYFGASTGGGAAIMAAAQRPEIVKAVVSRGGRPDLAGEALSKILAPTLLIVGGNDTVVIDLNKKALAEIRAVKQLVLVPKATHLFEEPGTLEQAAELAETWFLKYLK